MSRTPTGPPDEPMEDTPPHGVPPVTRAAIASQAPRPAQGGAYEDQGYEDEDEDQDDGAAGAGEWDDGGEAYGTAEPGDGAADGEPPTRVTRRRAGRARPAGRVYETGKGRRHHLTRRGRAVATVVGVLVVLAGALAWYETASNPFGSPGKPVLVHVHAGESFGDVASMLAKDQVIGTSLAFHVWSFVHGAPVVQPGTYQIRRNISFAAAKSALAAGPNVAEITVEPGMTISEIAGVLASLPGKLAHSFSDAGRTSGVRSPFQLAPGTPLEGLIGSGTYKVVPGESGRTLLTRMVARFVAQARSAGITPITTVAGLNAYQLVTLASIAQKEGYFTRYMGDVARVIFNRLAAGMRLDMTSTVLYSLGKDGGPVTPQEEQLTTPYNTYLHSGLTPTPICTSSVQALRAAVDPPAGTWLYFDLVTAKKGIMKFATTYTQQLALVHEAAANASKSSGGSSSSSTGSTT